MRRKVDAELDRWASREGAEPLLLRGARRVGKTYAIKRLGREAFGGDFAYCDFQTDLDQLTALFSGRTDVERIVRDLSVFLRRDIEPGRTLIALDEVQLCEKALNSLRFFAGSGYRVVASGSQLGLALKERKLPFPNEVETLHMHPMDFEEFCWAVGEERLAGSVREAFRARERFAFHEDALDLYRRYVVVGGMPKVVASYVSDGDYTEVRRLQSEVNHTYTADIALYAPPEITERVQQVWRSVPAQLARETTRKFKYADVVKGGRAKQFAAPIGWLESAEIVTLNHQTNDVHAPLTERTDGSFFKVYLPDTGLLYCRYNLAAEAFLDDAGRAALSSRFRGALAENYAMQCLVANGIEPFYWSKGSASHSEVEFLVQDRMGSVVPVEVKSGKNVASASLSAFMEKSGCPLAVRASERNFGFDGALFSVPLYALFCLEA